MEGGDGAAHPRDSELYFIRDFRVNHVSGGYVQPRIRECYSTACHFFGTQHTSAQSAVAIHNQYTATFCWTDESRPSSYLALHSCNPSAPMSTNTIWLPDRSIDQSPASTPRRTYFIGNTCTDIGF